MKLHGSFPAHSPFIFTEEDYRTYPRKFAPFVNGTYSTSMATEWLLHTLENGRPYDPSRWPTPSHQSSVSVPAQLWPGLCLRVMRDIDGDDISLFKLSSLAKVPSYVLQLKNRMYTSQTGQWTLQRSRLYWKRGNTTAESIQGGFCTTFGKIPHVASDRQLGRFRYR